jgi:hypothetical protein
LIDLPPLATRLRVPVLILAIGGIVSFLGFRYSVEIGGAILGTTAGSLVTYIIQSTEERESWSRDDQLFMAREIYGPLSQVLALVLEAIEKASWTGDYAALGPIAAEPQFGAEPLNTKKGGPYLEAILQSYWVDFADPKIIQQAKEVSELIKTVLDPDKNGSAFFNSTQFADIVLRIYRMKPDPGYTPSMHVKPRSRLDQRTDYANVGPVFHASFMKEKVLPPSKWEDLEVVFLRPNTRDDVPADSRVDELWVAARDYGPYADEVSKTRQAINRLKKLGEECRELSEQKVKAIFRP